MPKVKPLSPIEQKKLELKKYVKGKMAAEDIYQKDVGAALGVTQQAAGAKINSSSFSVVDLWKLFKMIGATDEEIIKIMKL